MKDIPPVQSYHGAVGLIPAQLLAPSPVVEGKAETYPLNPPPAGRYRKWLSWFRERRTRLSRSRRGRRRYRGVFFQGKSLYVRGASGHVYDHRFLRTKHRAKILRLSYTL